MITSVLQLGNKLRFTLTKKKFALEDFGWGLKALAKAAFLSEEAPLLLVPEGNMSSLPNSMMLHFRNRNWRLTILYKKQEDYALVALSSYKNRVNRMCHHQKSYSAFKFFARGGICSGFADFTFPRSDKKIRKDMGDLSWSSSIIL